VRVGQPGSSRAQSSTQAVCSVLGICLLYEYPAGAVLSIVYIYLCRKFLLYEYLSSCTQWYRVPVRVPAGTCMYDTLCAATRSGGAGPAVGKRQRDTETRPLAVAALRLGVRPGRLSN
jgi:hypothetical protein